MAQPRHISETLLNFNPRHASFVLQAIVPDFMNQKLNWQHSVSAHFHPMDLKCGIHSQNLSENKIQSNLLKKTWKHISLFINLLWLWFQCYTPCLCNSMLMYLCIVYVLFMYCALSLFLKRGKRIISALYY